MEIRMIKRALAAIAALAMLALGAVRLAAKAGGAFAYSDHLTDEGLYGSEKMGLMALSGEVLLPAEYASVYRFGMEDEGAPELYAVGDAAQAHEGWLSYSYALYDASGKRLTARDYTGFAWLEAGYIAAARNEGEVQVTDILDASGKTVKEALPVDYVVQGPNGFVGQNASGDAGVDAFFYDKDWNQVKKLRVDGLYTYNAPIGDKWLLPYQEGEKWGFLDERGEVAIQPAYDYANGFEGVGYASVEKDGKSTLIDMGGKELLPFTGGYYLIGAQFIMVSEGGTAALLRASDLKEIAPPGAYSTFQFRFAYEDVSSSGGGWAAGAREGGGYDFFSLDGRKIEQPDADYVSLGDGYAILSRGEDYFSADNTLLNLATGAAVPIGAGYGWFDGADRITMNDLESVRLLDLSGKEIAAHAMISSLYGTDFYVIQRRRFGQTRFGVIDKDGGVVLEPEYAILDYDWVSGVLAARKGGEAGYITMEGAWIYRHSAYNRLED